MQKKKKKNNQREYSFKSILYQNILFCALLLLVLIVGMTILAVERCETAVKNSSVSSNMRVEQRLNEAIYLLEALAAQPEITNPTVDPVEKAKRLNGISEIYGYYLICYVDKNLDVYSADGSTDSLAGRDYMQRLFATGEIQITDSFPAGADGVTLNYTVAVPIKDDSDEIQGVLFSAIYFENIQNILEDAALQNPVELILTGSHGQTMSSTYDDLEYGSDMNEFFRNSWILGTTADLIQERMLSGEGGTFWSVYKHNILYTGYERVANSNWNLVTNIELSSVFRELFPGMFVMAFFCIAITFIRTYSEHTDLVKQKKTIDMLLSSVGELERKIHWDEHPDSEQYDFNEIIQLTSKGLTDSLTGTVTRSVFLKQAQSLLDVAIADKITALCFIDVDNLKFINDSYGHQNGDVALKNVGFILREFEKRYHGTSGRYGGDEFVILFTNLENYRELINLLDELVLRLRTESVIEGQQVSTRCSIGVSIYQPSKTLEQLINEADESLYFVKHNGKGNYSIYTDRKTNEETKDI